MVHLPAGEFVMGENEDDRFTDDTERPAHRVSIPAGLSLGVFPVTLGEFRKFRQDHPFFCNSCSRFLQPKGLLDSILQLEGLADSSRRSQQSEDFRGCADNVCTPKEKPEAGLVKTDETLPVVDVTWWDACAYCKWLTALTGRTYRLPSEAEWEYACRAGSRSPFTFGDTLTVAEANFYYDEHGVRVGLGHPTIVGSYPANAFGLYDLHGNVCEWAQDTWHPNYRGAPQDGQPWVAPDSSRRVIRGGAWDYLPRLLRSAGRDWQLADRATDNVGFRVAAGPEGLP
jgi:formylglycine-generating enzyme required for sulfatase activity